jgi:hypothetical protein
MKPMRKVSRRSFIARVSGSAALFGSLSMVAGRAGALQVTDSDSVISDTPGRGRGPTTGVTDKDPADAIGNGGINGAHAGTGTPPQRPPRSPFQENNSDGLHAHSGYSDTDPSDPAGDGRARPQTAPASPYAEPESRHAYSGVTDSDPTDPVGDGRGANAPREVRRCSDTDAGPGHDPGGQGRHC